MTTETLDTSKHPLYSLLEPDVVRLAADPANYNGPDMDPSLISMAISLKRIAAAMQPVNVVEAKVPRAIAIDVDGWFGPQYFLLDSFPLNTLVDVEKRAGGVDQWLLGDAIDWSTRVDGRRRLKSTLVRWRPAQR